MADTAGTPQVSVRGEAVIEAGPEIATLVVTVAVRDRDRGRALERLARRNDETLGLVRAYGAAVDDVESSRFSVLPAPRDGRGERVRSYRGVVRINVTLTDFSVLGELAVRLADQELTTVDGPAWALRRDSPVYARARREAARAALARARDYAGALGARLTGVVELSDVGLTLDRRGPVPVDTTLYGGSPAPGAAAPPPITLEPQTQVVAACVEARFTISQPDDLNA